MWVTILTKLKIGKCQLNSIDSHSSAKQIQILQFFQFFSSNDAHMKIYLLSLFEWGEILYKKAELQKF